MTYWSQCPRCGHGTFENLRSYSHCVECLYSLDSHLMFESGILQAIGVQKQLDHIEIISDDSPQSFIEKQIII